MNIVLHDYFETAEGGGRLSFILAQGIRADLSYGFRAKGHPFFESQSFNGREFQLSSPSYIPLWRQLKLTKAFSTKTKFLNGYEHIVFSGFYTPLAIKNHLNGSNLYYCHTPPRFIYDQKDFYLNQIPIFSRPLLKAFIHYFQPRFEKALGKMDIIIANSHNTKDRIKKFLKLDSTIIYPPCDIDSFRWKKGDEYYLSTARLDPLKRIDLVVKAFAQMPDKKLIVTSGGNELDHLRRLAGQSANITFTGWVSEKKLQNLLANAIATIYIPRDEDFGMSPVESMAAGKPVIGVAEGGLLETVVEGETGVLLPPDPAVDQLCEAVSAMPPHHALSMREACEERAKLFSKEIFIEKMRQLINA